MYTQLTSDPLDPRERQQTEETENVSFEEVTQPELENADAEIVDVVDEANDVSEDD